MFKQFVLNCIKNKKRVFAGLISISVLSGVGAFLMQYMYGNSSVYRAELLAEAKPSVNIITAGMPVQIATWNGSEIKLECVSELELLIEETDKAITVKQDDGFAVSIFTADVFRYNLKVWLPEDGDYKEVNIISAGGDINIDGAWLSVKKITVSAKNGNIGIDGADSLFYIKTGTGNVRIDYISFLSPTVIETGSGAVELSVPDYASVSLDYITSTGKLYSGEFFPRRFEGYQGTVFAQRGSSPKKLYVNTDSGGLTIKEKKTDVIGHYSGV